MTPKYSLKPLAILVLAAVALAVSACSPKVDNRGYVSEVKMQDQLVPGTTTREEVLSKFGSPSSQSSFGEDTWYYVTARKEAYAFMRSDVVQQDVVRIEFDPAGVVKTVQYYDKDKAQDVTLVKRTTPTEGHTLGFIEQTLGNIGRFNRPTDAAANTAAPGRRMPR